MSRRMSRWLQIGLVLLGCVIGYAVAVLQQANIAGRRRASERTARQLASIEAGEREGLYLYETTGTDRLLESLAHDRRVRHLCLELTDVSEAGAEHIAKMPALHTLAVYGGRPGVTDAALDTLTGSRTISELHLVNTRVTAAGLRSLDAFLDLRMLTLYHSSADDSPLSERAFEQLRKLGTLNRLQVGGPWVAARTVERLRSSLPECHVESVEYWDWSAVISARQALFEQRAKELRKLGLPFGRLARFLDGAIAADGDVYDILVNDKVCDFRAEFGDERLRQALTDSRYAR